MTQEELRQLIIDTVYTNVDGEIEGNPLQQVLLDMVGNSGSNPMLLDSQITAPLPIAGGGTVALVNGSDSVVGAGTDFTDATHLGLSNTGRFWVQDGADWYAVDVTVNTATSATITAHYNLLADPLQVTDLGTTWTGSNLGAATVYAKANAVPAEMFKCVIIGVGNIVTAATTPNNVVIIGSDNVVKDTASCFILGDMNIATDNNPGVCIFGDQHTVENCTTRVSILGGRAETVSGATAKGALVTLENHADNTAALAAGLVVGQLYRTGGTVNVVV